MFRITYPDCVDMLRFSPFLCIFVYSLFLFPVLNPKLSFSLLDGLGLALNHHGFIGDASSSSSSRGSVNGEYGLRSAE